MTAMDLVKAEKYTHGELGELIGRSPRTIASWVKAGIGGVKLRQRKIGGRVFILKSDFEAFIEATTDTSDIDGAVA